ncbi:MAG TPA: hypothetical protein VG603_01215 [Chitinophagales bacterium]|nr:hypothetical protein [Chitinophagales bacterium]
MKKAILFIAVISMMASCKNLVPYTDAMKNNHGWSDDQVKSIQFYLSHDVILQRELTKGTSEIVQGKIKIVDGKRVDEILIKAGTPGVVTSIPKEDKLLVSFEVGDDHYLSFGVNPNIGQKYVLLASEWRNGLGQVHYGTDEYYTDPDSKYAYLMVDLRKIDKMSLNQHVAKGRKVQ